jgi:hypothetical protein
MLLLSHNYVTSSSPLTAMSFEAIDNTGFTNIAEALN